TRSSLYICLIALFFISPSIQSSFMEGSQLIGAQSAFSPNFDGPGSLSYSVDITYGKREGFVDLLLVDEKNYKLYLDKHSFSFYNDASFHQVTFGEIDGFILEDK